MLRHRLVAVCLVYVAGATGLIHRAWAEESLPPAPATQKETPEEAATGPAAPEETNPVSSPAETIPTPAGLEVQPTDTPSAVPAEAPSAVDPAAVPPQAEEKSLAEDTESFAGDDPPQDHRLAAEDDDTDDDMEAIDWTLRDGRRLPRAFPLSVGVGIWPNTFSVQAMMATPVLPRGFIHGINDSFALEFGLIAAAVRSDYYWSDGHTGWQLWPAFGARWDFFLTRGWSSFITLKFIGQIAVSGAQPDWFSVLAGAGAHYRINDFLSLRMELNFPQGLSFALAVPLGYTRGPERLRHVAALAPKGYKTGP